MTRMANLICLSIATVLLVGCTSVEQRLSLKKPEARLIGVRIEDATRYAANVVFDVDVVNYYPETVPLRSFRYVVSSGDMPFLSGTAEVRINLPPGAQRTVSLPVRIDYLEAVKRLPGVGPGATIPYGAQLDLTVDTPRLGPLVLSTSREGQLSLPAVPAANP